MHVQLHSLFCYKNKLNKNSEAQIWKQTKGCCAETKDSVNNTEAGPNFIDSYKKIKRVYHIANNEQSTGQRKENDQTKLVSFALNL